MGVSPDYLADSPAATSSSRVIARPHGGRSNRVAGAPCPGHPIASHTDGVLAMTHGRASVHLSAYLPATPIVNPPVESGVEISTWSGETARIRLQPCTSTVFTSFPSRPTSWYICMVSAT